MKESSFPKISAVIITKNAQRCLNQVIISLKNIADEIVIVDSGSTDDTLRIAKAGGARIFKQKWLGYGPQKNFGFDRAKNNWILSLDADEVIGKDLAEELKSADYRKHDGFYLPYRSFFGKEWVRHSGWYPGYQLRLFRKDKMRFDNKLVHEAINPVGNIGYMKNDVFHYSYISNKQYFQKIEGYTTLDAKFLYNKKRPWTIFYQIGKPIKEFFEIYFGKKGYLDGFLGLKISLFSAYYRWLVAKKLRNLYKNKMANGI